jgi:hypothetical protein
LFSGSLAPNNSFKPTPCLGFVETCRGASNTGSSPPRSARLNSGVRPQNQKHSNVENLVKIQLSLTMVVLALLTGCASMTQPMKYAKSEPIGKGPGGASPGYAEKEISPGVYVVEVRQIGGYQFIVNSEGTEHIYVSHWKRRASELCPSGYVGEPSWIRPMEAQIYQFRCELRFCQNYPMVSGTVACKQP